MTRKEVVALCVALAAMPIARVVVDCDVPEWDGDVVTLTRKEYMRQLAEDRPGWSTGQYGAPAYYDDEASEVLQAAWYEQARIVRDVINEYTCTHKMPLPKHVLDSIA